jgi:hypothetical protein
MVAQVSPSAVQSVSTDDVIARARLAPSIGGGSMLDWILTQPGLVERDGVWCEFGVYVGKTMSLIAKYRGGATEFWGFDSFRGLPETWNAAHPRGRFALPQIPMPPGGVRLMVGYFSETLPSWVPAKPVTFGYVDCDLYSSATDVFDAMARYCAPGAVIVIDDFFMPPLDNGVARALAESRLSYEWVARRGAGENESVAIRLTSTR